MWKVTLIIVGFLYSLEYSDGKTYKMNLNPLKKLNSTNPNCELKSYFSSNDEFLLFQNDLKFFCPSSLSKSAMEEQMKEQSIVLCQLLLAQLTSLCSTDRENAPSFSFNSTMSKDKLCQLKLITASNELLFKLSNLQQENPLKIDSNNLCEKIVNDQTTKLVRFLYKLTSALKRNPPRDDSSSSNKTNSTLTTTVDPKLNNNNSSINTNSSLLAAANQTEKVVVANISTTVNVSNGNSTLNSTKVDNATSTDVQLNVTTTKVLDLSKDQTKKQPDANEDEDEDEDKDKDKDKEEGEGEDQPNDKDGKKTEQKSQIDSPTKEDVKENMKSENENKDKEDEGNAETNDQQKQVEEPKENQKKDDGKDDRAKEENKDEQEEEGEKQPEDGDEYPQDKNPDVEHGPNEEEVDENEEKQPVGKEEEEEEVEVEMPDDNPDDNDIVETNEDAGMIENPNENDRFPNDKIENNQQETDEGKQPVAPSVSNQKKNEAENPAAKGSGTGTKKYDSDQGSSGSFVTYFLLFTLFVVVGYLILHNKNKVLGLLIEGCRRNHSHGRRSGTNSGRYHRLSQSS